MYKRQVVLRRYGIQGGHLAAASLAYYQNHRNDDDNERNRARYHDIADLLQDVYKRQA